MASLVFLVLLCAAWLAIWLAGARVPGRARDARDIEPASPGPRFDTPLVPRADPAGEPRVDPGPADVPADPSIDPPVVDFDSDDELMEVILAASLLTGHLSAGQYRRGMALLAARDEIRHPLAVPPDTGRGGP